MGVLYATPVSKYWSNEGVKAFFFNFKGAAVQIALEEGQSRVGLVTQCTALCIPADLTVYVDTKVFG